MKKYHILLILFLLLFHVAPAQPEGQFLADSLEQALHTKGISDKVRVDLLTHLCYEYRNLSPGKAIEFGNQAESIAKRIHYEMKLGEIYLSLAYSYAFFSDQIQAHEYALMAIKYNTQYNQTDLIPDSKIWALSTNPNLKKEALRDSLMGIMQGIDKIKNKKWYIIALGNLGIGFIHVNCGNIADSLLSKAITDARKYHYKFLEMHNLARMAIKYNNIDHQYDTAISLFNKVNSYLKSIHEKRIFAELLNYEANSYMQKYSLGHHKADLDSAALLNKQSLQIASLLGYKRMLLFNYHLSADINTKKGQLQSVIDDQKKYIALNDSLYGLSARSRLEALAIKQKDEIAAGELKLVQVQMKYEFDKKESLAKAEIARQKLVRNFSVTGAFGMLFLGGYIFYNFRKRKKLENEQALSDERLRISRELHDDIGSTLGSIAVYSDVARNRSVKNENPSEVLTKIGTASRELIEKMSDIVWSLNTDNENLEQMQNRMQAFAAMILTPRNIMVEFKSDDALQTLQLTSEQRKNIFLIFKEAVHNIVKYADCSVVGIFISRSGNNLCLSVKDNGKGFEVPAFDGSSVSYNGNGLKNMRARAAEMKASMNITSIKNQGTAVILEVNI